MSREGFLSESERRCLESGSIRDRGNTVDVSRMDFSSRAREHHICLQDGSLLESETVRGCLECHENGSPLEGERTSQKS